MTELAKEFYKTSQTINLCNMTVTRALETASLEDSDADVGVESMPTREKWHAVAVRTVNPNLQPCHVRGGLERCGRDMYCLASPHINLSPFSLQLRSALRFHL